MKLCKKEDSNSTVALIEREKTTTDIKNRSIERERERGITIQRKVGSLNLCGS